MKRRGCVRQVAVTAECLEVESLQTKSMYCHIIQMNSIAKLLKRWRYVSLLSFILTDEQMGNIYCKFALFFTTEILGKSYCHFLTLFLGFQVIQKENPAHMNLQVKVIVVSQMRQKLDYSIFKSMLRLK